MARQAAGADDAGAMLHTLEARKASSFAGLFRGFLGCVLLRPLENRGCMALVFPPAGSDMAG